MNWVKSWVKKVRPSPPPPASSSSTSPASPSAPATAATSSPSARSAAALTHTPSSWPASASDLAAVFGPDPPPTAAALAAASADLARATAPIAADHGHEHGAARAAADARRFASPDHAALAAIDLAVLAAAVEPVLDLFLATHGAAPDLDLDLDRLNVTTAPMPAFVAAVAHALRGALVAAGRSASSRAAAADASAAALDACASHVAVLTRIVACAGAARLASVAAAANLPSALAKAVHLAAGPGPLLAAPAATVGPAAGLLAALITASQDVVDELIDADLVFVLCKLPAAHAGAAPGDHAPLLAPLAALLSPPALAVPATAKYVLDKGCFRAPFATLLDALDTADPASVLATVLALCAAVADPDLPPHARPTLLRAFDCGPDVYLVRVLEYLTTSGTPAHVDALISAVVDLLYANPGASSSAAARAVTYPRAFGVLAAFFTSCSSPDVRVELLDLILSIFAVDPDAYDVCDGANVVGSFLLVFPSFSPVVQTRLVKLVQFVATSLRPHPTSELTRLAHVLTTLPLADPATPTILTVFSSLVAFDSAYRDEFRELGVVDALVAALDPAFDPHAAPAPSSDAVFATLAALLDGSPTNIRAARSAGIVAHLHGALAFDSLRHGALALLIRLVGADKRQEHSGDVMHYMELLHVHAKACDRRTAEMLNAVALMFEANPNAKATFRDVGVFDTLVSILNSLGASLHGPLDLTADTHALVLAIFRVLFAGLASHEENYAFFITHITPDALGRILASTGVLDSPAAPLYVYLLVAMATTALTSPLPGVRVGPPPLPGAVFGADAWDALVRTGPTSPLWAPTHQLAHQALRLGGSLDAPDSPPLPLVFTPATELDHPVFLVLALTLVLDHPPLVADLFAPLANLIAALATASDANAAALGSVATLATLLHSHATWLDSEHHRAAALAAVRAIGAIALAPPDLRALLNMFTKAPPASAALFDLTNTLLHLASPSASAAPFVAFDMRGQPGFATLVVPSLGSRSWPPATGYTFGAWLYIDALNASDLLRLVTISSDDKRSYLSLALHDATLLLFTTPTDSATLAFPEHTFRPRRWYHVVVTHSRSRLHSSLASLYVDGTLVSCQKCPYPSSTSGTVAAALGTSPSARGSASSAAFKLGPTYMLEAVAPPRDVHLWYVLSPRYSGTFDPSLAPYQTFDVFNGRNLAMAHTLDAAESSSSSSDPAAVAGLAAAAVAALATRAASSVLAVSPRRSPPPAAPAVGSAPSIIPSCSYLNFATATFSTLTGSNIVFAFSAKSFLNLSAKVTSSGGGNTLVASSHLLNLATASPAPARSLVAPPTGPALFYELERAALASASALVADTDSGSIGRLMGRTGAYTPSTLATVLPAVGGMSVALELVSGASTHDELFARVSLLAHLCSGSPQNLNDMAALAGYEILAQIMLDKVAANLVDHATLNALVALVGPDIVAQDNGIIACVDAFDALFANPALWAPAPLALQHLLFARLTYLVTDSSLAEYNCAAFRHSAVLTHVLEFMLAPSTPDELLPPAATLVGALLRADPVEPDFISLVHYIVATLNTSFEAEQAARPTSPSPGRRTKRRRARSTGAASAKAFHAHVLDSPSLRAPPRAAPVMAPAESRVSRLVVIRNMLLTLLLDALAGPPRGSSAPAAQVAFDVLSRRTARVWVLFFLERNVHPTTARLALRIFGLLALGGAGPSGAYVREFKGAGGFDALAHVLPHAASDFELYVSLFAILLGQPDALVTLPPGLAECATDATGTFAEGATALQVLVDTFGVDDARVALGDIVSVLLAMLKARCADVLAAPDAEAGSASGSAGSSTVEVALLKFVTFLFKASPSFRDLASQPDVICLLVEVLFPRAVIVTGMIGGDDGFVVVGVDGGDESSGGDASPSARPLSPTSPKTVVRRELADFYGLTSSVGSESEDPASETSGRAAAALPDTLSLFQHPVSGLIFDFLRTLVQESFFDSDAGLDVLNTVLEAVPPYVSRDQLVMFQSKLLSDLMAYFGGSLSVAKFQAQPGLGASAEALYALLVAKVYQKSFPGGGRLVFDFLVALFGRLGVERSAGPELLGPLADAIGLIVLHELHAAVNGSGRERPIAVLHRVLLHQQAVFSSANESAAFYGCFCFLLYRFVLDDDASVRKAAMNLWKLLLLERKRFVLSYMVTEGGDVYTGGFEALVQARDFNAFSYWVAENDGLVRSVFEATLGPVWATFEAEHVRGHVAALRDANEARAAAQAARVKAKQSAFAAMKKDDMRRMNRVVGIQHIHAVQRRKRRVNIADRTKQVAIMWRDARRALFRQRGLWEDPARSALIKWRLDRTEGPDRIRIKREVNEGFYAKFPFLGDGQNMGDGGKIPTSRHSAAWAALDDAAVAGSTVPTLAVVADGASEAAEADGLGGDGESSSGRSGEADTSGGGTDAGSELEVEVDDDETSETETSDDGVLVGRDEGQWSGPLGGDELVGEERTDRKIMRLLSPGERIRGMYNCARVVGLDTWPALFLVCETAVYVIDYYRAGSDGEIEDVSGASMHEVDPALGALEFSAAEAAEAGHRVVSWAYSDIGDVLKRRYLLRDNALELFSVDGRNDLVMFDIKQRNEVVSKIKARCSSSSRSPLEALGGLFTSSAVSWGQRSETGKVLASAPAAGSSGSRRGLKLFASSGSSATAKWVEGALSNFEYLMHLNTEAGRSYNDLTQYPVFPWILADYTSTELDLSDESVYRDLSQPMGALGAERRAQFEERYEMWEDDVVPPFHYGTHYSSAGSVLHYLIRVEPFTSHFLKLQGGKFDHPDRLFASVAESWHSASAGNMSDVKELIPEFFYLPDFLVNANAFELGVRQDGAEVDNVELPPWAGGDARTFVRIHRQALESEYVSAHLHEWIDLVFGYKQTGPAAVEAVNVFYHLTYEGAVDIAAIDDPVLKAATISQINNFGQTPRQLFKKPHPARRARAGAEPMTVLSAPHKMLPSTAPVLRVGGVVGEVRVVADALVAAPALATLVLPHCNKVLSWGYADHALVERMAGDGGKELGRTEGMHFGQLTAVLMDPSGAVVYSGGEDCTVCVWASAKPRKSREFALLARLAGHEAPVSCLALSRSFSIFLSGSMDGTAIVWDLNRRAYVRQLTGHGAPVRQIAVNHASGQIVTITLVSAFVWTVNGELVLRADIGVRASDALLSVALSLGPVWRDDNVVVTGHADGTINVWSVAGAELEHRHAVTVPPPASPDDAAALTALWREVHDGQAVLTTLGAQAGDAVGVTALVVSPDTRRMYSGDILGRVFSWSLPDGGSSDYWDKDEEVKACRRCSRSFTLLDRRHHCRICGSIVCGKCSANRVRLSGKGGRMGRACDACVDAGASAGARRE